jgi:hypothetical protein
MGMLSEEQAAAIRQTISGTPSSPEPSAPEPAPVSSEASPDVNQASQTSESTESVETSAAPSDQGTSAPEPAKKSNNGQKVPYGRFRNVLDARNKYKSQAERYKATMSQKDAELEQLRQQLSSYSRPQIPAPAPVAAEPQPAAATKETSWLDDLLGTNEAAPEQAETTATQDYVAKMQEMMQAQEQKFGERMYKYEVNQAQRELEDEIRTVRTRYPSLQAKDLAQLVVNDPTVDLMETAETFMTYKVSLEEEAIARYLRDNPHLTQAEKQAVVEAVQTDSAQVAAPVAPPRPAGSRGAQTGTVAAKAEPRELKKVKYALRDYFKSNNPFAS